MLPTRAARPASGSGDPMVSGATGQVPTLKFCNPSDKRKALVHLLGSAGALIHCGWKERDFLFASKFPIISGFQNSHFLKRKVFFQSILHSIGFQYCIIPIVGAVQFSNPSGVWLVNLINTTWLCLWNQICKRVFAVDYPSLDGVSTSLTLGLGTPFFTLPCKTW